MFQNIKDAIVCVVIVVLLWYAWRLTHWVSRLESRFEENARLVAADIGAALEDVEARVEKRVEKIESRLAPIEKWFLGWFR